ncbi:unnamed protein product [Ixodes hexagonus]
MESETQTANMVRLFEARYDVCVNHAVGSSGGCLLFLKFMVTVEQVISCDSGRFVLCDFVFSNIEFRVLCIYAPTKVDERVVFFREHRKICANGPPRYFGRGP